MIIYVNIDKNTGEISINNDMYPNTDVVEISSSTVQNDDNTTKFEIAFNTTSFEKLYNISENINGNTN
jgi:hypothetical protein